MTKELLEFYLNRKNVFGFNTYNEDQKVGWILLSKRFPTPKFFELVSEEENPRGHQRQRRIQQEPYWLMIEEVTRAVFESDRFPTENDYLLKIGYSFRTLDDVESFLKEIGFGLAEIKWGADIDFL